MSNKKEKPEPAAAPARVGSVSAQASEQAQISEHARRNPPATPADAAPTISIAQARSFLHALDPEEERFHFRTLPEGGSNGAPGQYYGTLEEVADQLTADNRFGSGVFVVVNAGGQRANEICRIRAVFADSDGKPLSASLPLEPHIKVQSGPHGQHAYWLVDGLPVDQFTAHQKAIAAALNTDPAVCDLPRLMRLPGFLHAKGKPYLTHILELNGALPYTPEQIASAFPLQGAHLFRSGLKPFLLTSNVGRVIESDRHADLIVLAARTARLVVGPAGLSYDNALSMLVAEVERGRYTRDVPLHEVKSALDSALAKFRNGTWPLPSEHTTLSDAVSDPDAMFGGEWDGAAYRCTHVANAQRVGIYYGSQLLYADGIGWHVFSPPWRSDGLGALRIVQGLGQRIKAEADSLMAWAEQATDDDERAAREGAANARYNWAKSSEFRSNLDATLALAAAHMYCLASELDANVRLLGMPEGVLDLVTLEKREHRQSDLITKVTGTNFDPDAPAPLWRAFLDQIMAGNAELVAFLQRLFGYALTGTCSEHILPIFWGTGANGKTTLLTAIQDALGAYANSAAPGLLLLRGHQEHPTGLADLQGRRVVIVSETGEASRLNEEQVKVLTGGDTITARRMRQDFFTFKPTHVLFLQTNYRPKITGTDEGIWRRIILIPFAVTIPREQRDPDLPAKLRAEAPGILAWIVEGLREYRRIGLSVPTQVRLATRDYRDASDQISEYLLDRVEVGVNLSEAIASLYVDYQHWCTENGDRQLGKREFVHALKLRNFEPSRTNAGRRLSGLQLLAGATVPRDGGGRD